MDLHNVVVPLLLCLWSGMRLAMVSVILSSSCLSSLPFSLTAFSINSLQLLLSFAVVLHSSPSLSRSPLTQSFYRIIGLPRLLFPPLLGYFLSLFSEACTLYIEIYVGEAIWRSSLIVYLRNDTQETLTA